MIAFIQDIACEKYHNTYICYSTSNLKCLNFIFLKFAHDMQKNRELNRDKCSKHCMYSVFAEYVTLFSLKNKLV
jgi:hypothetical protein